jgi:hypothetical protein
LKCSPCGSRGLLGQIGLLRVECQEETGVELETVPKICVLLTMTICPLVLDYDLIQKRSQRRRGAIGHCGDSGQLHVTAE